MRDATADHLKQQLNAFVQLPPASDARMQGTQRTYDVLKAYLMMTRPDKADEGWLAKNVLITAETPECGGWDMAGNCP